MEQPPPSTHSIAVYCGSSMGTRPLYTEHTRALATLIARRGCTLVYGGGRLGLMGILADAALAAGGRVHGVIPHFMVNIESQHTGCTILEKVADMRHRKARMAELAQAFITLPGGLGTWEEVLEILTLVQLRQENKPVVLLNTGGFYNPLLALMDHAVEEGFIKPGNRNLLRVANTPEEALEMALNTSLT